MVILQRPGFRSGQLLRAASCGELCLLARWAVCLCEFSVHQGCAGDRTL